MVKSPELLEAFVGLLVLVCSWFVGLLSWFVFQYLCDSSFGGWAFPIQPINGVRWTFDIFTTSVTRIVASPTPFCRFADLGALQYPGVVFLLELTIGHMSTCQG